MDSNTIKLFLHIIPTSNPLEGRIFIPLGWTVRSVVLVPANGYSKSWQVDFLVDGQLVHSGNQETCSAVTTSLGSRAYRKLYWQNFEERGENVVEGLSSNPIQDKECFRNA